MRFNYEGKLYRIVFRHDKPVDLAAHTGHLLGIEDVSGKKRVVCYHCSIPLTPLGKKRRLRSTHCAVQVWNEQSGWWITTHEGTSKVNLKAGDRFCKADGRDASVTNALKLKPGEVGNMGSFERVAIDCFDLYGAVRIK